jgi:trans-2,3-dihydro-3-hydroxyanthranilate isomerase
VNWWLKLDSPIFYIVDVFAEQKYSGNQLAVFRFTQQLTSKEMQQIAREINFSETTFILSDTKRDNAYDVRIFTPHNEVPFAGHPTLGTAFIIHEEIEKKQGNEVVLNLKAGRVPVFFASSDEQSDVLWMKQLEPVFGDTYDAETVSKILDIDVNEIDSRFPIQEVSTGLPAVIVPLKTLESVKRVKIVNNRYLEFTEDIEAKTILVFCPETYDKKNDLNVRFFAGRYGIPEDPATGSANGCLAGYLVKHTYFGEAKIDLKVEQGYEVGRPSLLLLNAEQKKDGIEVNVGGKVKLVAKGKLVK